MMSKLQNQHSMWSGILFIYDSAEPPRSNCKVETGEIRSYAMSGRFMHQSSRSG